MGESTKAGGLHIGQKGLGFKSVFMCTQRPHIVSGPWSFKFDRSMGSDELAYITPLWLEPQQLPEPLRQAQQLLPGHTHVLLPLQGPLQQRRQLVHGVRACLAELSFMVNLRHLAALRLVDHGQGLVRQVRISRAELPGLPASSSDNTASSSSDGAADGSISWGQVQGKLVQLLVQQSAWQEQDTAAAGMGGAASAPATEGLQQALAAAASAPAAPGQQLSFRAFTASVPVSEGIRLAEPDSAAAATITIAFPQQQPGATSSGPGSSDTSPEAEQVFPICAYLPVCNLGLPFLLNSDWVLVASREAVKESSSLNALLRDSAADLMAQVGNGLRPRAAWLVQPMQPQEFERQGRCVM